MTDTTARCLNCGADGGVHAATARDVEYGTTDEWWEYLRCRACGVLYLAHPPRGRLAEIYPPTYYSFSDEGASLLERVKRRLDVRFLSRVLRDVGGRSLAVLDVGGGTGQLASAARAADARVSRSVVVDIDEACRSDAERHGHVFVRSRIEEYDPDERFDLILAYNLIEHVDDPRGVLRALGGRLSPAGRVVLKTPNIDSLDARIFRRVAWGGLHCPRHWVLFDERSLRTAAASAGLVVERLDYTQGAPFWAVSILSLAEEHGWFRREDGRPMMESPLYRPVLALAAAFDFARRPFARTSQMLVVLRRQEVADAGGR